MHDTHRKSYVRLLDNNVLYSICFTAHSRLRLGYNDKINCYIFLGFPQSLVVPEICYLPPNFRVTFTYRSRRFFNAERKNPGTLAIHPGINANTNNERRESGFGDGGPITPPPCCSLFDPAIFDRLRPQRQRRWAPRGPRIETH